MKVTLLQDDLQWMLDNQPTPSDNILKFNGRHRLGSGVLPFLPLGMMTLADGQPVVDVGSKVIDGWFLHDNEWMLPSRRNVARMAKLFGLSWPQAFHLQLKLEWERFLTETQPVAGDGQSQFDPVRLVPEDEPLSAVVRQKALPLKTWPVRTYQKLDGTLANVDRYPDLIDEFCEHWLTPRIDDIQKETEAALTGGMDTHAFTPPGPRRQAGHSYYILADFIVHQDIQRASVFSAIAQQFHAALRGFAEQYQTADSTEQVACLMRMEKWYAASRAFDAAAMQLESARQIHKQIETRWYVAFGAVYSDFLQAQQRKEKLRSFLAWLKENPRLTGNELEQRYAAEQGAKDRADVETLAAGRVVAGLNERLKGEGASQDEVLEYFSDMKRMYRSIAWLTHPDRHSDDVPDAVRAQLNALWLEAAAIRRGDQRANTTLRRADLRRLIQRARDLCQQANLPFEERLLPFEADLPSTNAALLREIGGLESDVRRVATELGKLASDYDFVSKRRDLEPPEAVQERVAVYEEEVDQLRRDIAGIEAEVEQLQQATLATARSA